MRKARRFDAALTTPELVSPAHHPLDRLIHRAGLDNLVADHSSLGAIALQPPLVLDRLTRQTVSDCARQSHVSGAGDDALLARGESHERSLLGDDVIDREKDLAVAADGEGFDRGDDWFFHRVAAEFVGGRIGKCKTAIKFVDIAEVAHLVPQIRNPPVIEMRRD